MFAKDHISNHLSSTATSVIWLSYLEDSPRYYSFSPSLQAYSTCFCAAERFLAIILSYFLCPNRSQHFAGSAWTQSHLTFLVIPSKILIAIYC